MKTSLFLTVAALSLHSLSAEAVITRHCPETLTLAVQSASFLSENEIRDLPRHSRYNEERMVDVVESRDRLENLLTTDFQTGQFTLVSRGSGKCTYIADDKDVEMNRIVLFSKGGVDYLKQEIEMLEKVRDEELFSFQAVLETYGAEGVTLKNEGATEVFTTIKHACYDRVCLADALIGTAEFAAE